MTETQREQIAADIYPMLAERADDPEWPMDWQSAKETLPEDDREVIDFVYQVTDYVLRREVER